MILAFYHFIVYIFVGLFSLLDMATLCAELEFAHDSLEMYLQFLNQMLRFSLATFSLYPWNQFKGNASNCAAYTLLI